MCTHTRALQEFPTRKYAYLKEGPAGVAELDELPQALEPGHVYRFIAGRDATPASISPEQGRQLLGDAFAQLVLFSGNPLPTSLRALLTQLDRSASSATVALPVQRSFVVADGGQIPWTKETNDLNRDFRFVIVRQRDQSALADLLVSASTNLDSNDAFLQVIGWDPSAGSYEFYDRRDGSWVWAGSSWDALTQDSRGHGPFDSHVNGALNMKELKLPWVNWHSQSATILDSALAPDDPLRLEGLWTGRSPAQDFEISVARPGIKRWSDSRFQRSIRDGAVSSLPQFMRQVLETTTVNLVSSPSSNASLMTTQIVQLPLTFFLASDALIDVLGLSPNISVPQVKAEIYREMLTRYRVRVSDGTFAFPGDTHFVFVVPEPAFEDLVILQGMLDLGILTPKLAAALLMVDFSNPVFSARRAALMRFVPGSARVQDADFSEKFVSAVQQSVEASTASSPESEFLANWSLAESAWEKEFERRIEDYFAALSARFATADGFSGLFELGESRRREFRKRPLAEFRLTTPITNIPEDASFLELTPQGSVRCKQLEML
jgi:hypothetical protein